MTKRIACHSTSSHSTDMTMTVLLQEGADHLLFDLGVQEVLFPFGILVLLTDLALLKLFSLRVMSTQNMSRTASRNKSLS